MKILCVIIFFRCNMETERIFMKCPNLNNQSQSLKKGQKRFDQALDNLGFSVVSKIMSFSLYALGYPYEYISNTVGISEAGIKTIVQDLNKNGIERFIDKRKKENYPNLKKTPEKSPAPQIDYIEDGEEHDEFKLDGPITLKIKKNDVIGKKILTLFFVNVDLLKKTEAAEILNCKRLAVHRNLKKFRTVGTKGLFDNRKGQKKDYKYDSNIKAEIIKQYLLKIIKNEKPTKTKIRAGLADKFSKEYSERAVALHLKNLGLTDNKKGIRSEIVQLVNEKIYSLEFLEFKDEKLESKFEIHLEPLKKFNQELRLLCGGDKRRRENFFRIEKRIETLWSELQPLVIESVVKEVNDNINECPFCDSTEINKYNPRPEKSVARKLDASFGGRVSLYEGQLLRGNCCNCKKEFNVKEDFLELSETSNFTPLTQMKVCSANRAGSYENAAKNLKELINLNLNRNQVRKISNYIGEYIIKEFEELYNDIVSGLPPRAISKKHPLLEKIKIDEKYLDKSKYIILLAIDGGRIQLFNWIPPKDEKSKAKKSLYWHENKVFRISIYDKSDWQKNADRLDDSGVKKIYKSAKMISGLSTYGATNLKWRETAPLIISHLYARGIRPEDVQICISDGSEHIMSKIFKPVFPNAVHILDYYHKAEGLHKCLKSLGMANGKSEEKLKNHLWEGDVIDLLKALKEIQLKIGKPGKGKRDQENPKVKLDNLISHLSKNSERLKYKTYRKQGYPIGSGSVESAVKLFAKRIKGTEKQWNEEGGEAILHLYAFLLSEDDRWKKLWDTQTPWL